MTARRAQARIAVDIGGTFTDVVLEHDDSRITVKVLTTSEAPDDGVIAGLRDVLDRSPVNPSAVGLIIHGTTLATNAILERKGARTALITTEGFRDVLEIGYESRFNQYDIMIEKPRPLVPRDRRLTVPERVDVNGRVLEPIDETKVAALVPELVRLGIESVAVGFLHSYANPAHETRVRDLLQQAMPGLSVTLSSEACPEVREYERFSTAVANAYVRPLMESYLGRLKGRLDSLGLYCPLLLMTSGGGLTTLETAMRFPIRLVESGPAGGAILASHIAAEMGLDKVISFDMGGTTAKICLIENYRPKSAREFEVDRAARFTKGSGLPLRIPVIEMVEIGAGGGSIARVDAMSRIAVGPDSAGAEPGPAAYNRGGDHPTVTDADILLGRIEPSHFAGGKVALAPERASEAIARDIGNPLGLDPLMAAYGITEMVDETMANAARVHAVEQGEEAAGHALVAFGGAAPLHVGRLAEKLAVDRIVVPANAGVGSAVGFLRAPVAYEVVRSRNMRLRDFEPAAANQLISAMRAEALGVVQSGAPEAEIVETRGAYMRYLGQGHEIFVTLPLRELDAGDHETLQSAYNRQYQAHYRRIIPDAEIEVLTWSVTISTAHDRPLKAPEPPACPAPEPVGMRDLIDPESSQPISVPLYWRSDLGPGASLDGPAIIAEDETSTFIGRRFGARIGANGHILIERNQEDAT
ncbi:MAG TPA: hydantoinase/oxoprolinase family protein [Gammaproteobacteria bacterium]|nr:hydantoinase/oxoprolinase family protein [Gammaproteobacteria bacterium]